MAEFAGMMSGQSPEPTPPAESVAPHWHPLPAEDVKHVVFWAQTPDALKLVCQREETAGWALVRVVQHTAFESIAVFTRRAHIYGPDHV